MHGLYTHNYAPAATEMIKADEHNIDEISKHQSLVHHHVHLCLFSPFLYLILTLIFLLIPLYYFLLPRLEAFLPSLMISSLTSTSFFRISPLPKVSKQIVSIVAKMSVRGH